MRIALITIPIKKTKIKYAAFLSLRHHLKPMFGLHSLGTTWTNYFMNLNKSVKTGMLPASKQSKI